jgi:hypothetical protein
MPLKKPADEGIFWLHSFFTAIDSESNRRSQGIMNLLLNRSKQDTRDKRYAVRRRRRRPPWFMVACAITLFGLTWASKRLVPAGSGHRAKTHADAGITPVANDW